MKKPSKTQRKNAGPSFDIASWLSRAAISARPALRGPRMALYGSPDEKSFAARVKKESFGWQKSAKDFLKKDLVFVANAAGPVWLVKQREFPKRSSHEGRLEETAYTYFRDVVGSLVGNARAQGAAELAIEFNGMDEEQTLGALVGLELASYVFKDHLKGAEHAGLPKLKLFSKDKKFLPPLIREAITVARAINRARHWVNLPPNIVNPPAFAEALASLSKVKGLTVEVWDEKRLAEENMNLHLAVGQGSVTPPRLVKLSWRPPNAVKNAKPRVLVGKGITFDTGGLDIKPSSGMRLMKKDMGGAAAVLAVGFWAAEAGCPFPIEVYAALAENSVDGTSFRPSDVIRARNGAYVEIDNTDAEGRLVLADALDLAVTEHEDAECVVDVATLTGAIKVALGAEIAGLFSNDDRLSEELSRAGQRVGDLSWRMPLLERYFGGLSSNFADFKNSTEGFGGAITAALFLSRFVRGKRWAHLDIYAWNDKPMGGLSFAGGSGQAVQKLISWLMTTEAEA